MKSNCFFLCDSFYQIDVDTSMFQQKRFNNMVRLTSFARGISISQAPTATIPHSISPSNVNVPKELSEFPRSGQSSQDNQAPLEKVVFDTIGTPQSTLSIKVPPSVPISIKRGSLISLFTGSSSENAISSTTAQLEVKSPVRRFLLGGITSSYQRIISTVQLDLLISAYTPKSTLRSYFPYRENSSKTFANIALDGTIDWAVFPSNAIHCYSGEALSIRTNILPSKVSKEGSRKFNISRGSTTGLFSWVNPGYNLISGRGSVSLLGTGSIFRLSLEEGEEILLKRSNILATTTNGATDLQDGSFLATSLHHNFTGKSPESEVLINPDEIPSKESYISKVSAYLKPILETLKITKDIVYETVVGNGTYIRVAGPRVVLIQSNGGLDKFVMGSGSSSNISKVEKFITDIKDFKKPALKSGDFLSYATVVDGKVSFRNTPNFNETIQKLEGSSKNKE